MRLELKELRQRVPTTSVFVTHDQVEAMTLGDRIVVMKDGLVQQVGSPLALFASPVNRFVASFIGSPAMNFLDMAVAAQADTFRLTAEGVAIELPQLRFPRLGAHVGRSVTLGCGHSTAPGQCGNGAQVAFSGNLMVTEQLGDEQLLAVRIGSGDLRVSGSIPSSP
jgi:multiple sugar transport system ATP-binding protein